MPGIYGAIAFRGSDALQSCFENMGDRLMHRDWYVRSGNILAGGALGCIAQDNDVGTAKSGDTLLAFYGDIVDIDQMHRNLASVGSGQRADAPLPHLLLQTYLRFGRASLEDLNGYYAVAIWNARDNELTVIPDRGGDAKVHYWANDEMLLFAPESKAICWHPKFNKAIDPLAAYELFSLTFPLEDRTLFRDIRLVPPAHALVCRDGQVRCSRYWEHGSAPVEKSDASLRSYADGYYQRLHGAVKKRLRPEDTGIFVTGGLDSRVLAGLMNQCAPGTVFDSITSGDPAGHDIRFGGKVARACGFKHHRVRVGGDYLPLYAPEAIRRNEGLTTSHVCWAISSDPLIEQRGLRYMYNGYLGCGNVNAGFPDDYNPNHAFHLMLDRAFHGLLHEARCSAFVRPELYKAMRGHSIDVLRRQFDNLNNFDTSVRCEIIRRDEQHRRFIGIDLELQGAVTRLQYPYTDNDVWDYLLNIPMPFRRGKLFFLDLLQRHFPKLASMPRSGSGVPISGPQMKRLFHRGKQRVYHRVLPRLSCGRLGGRNLEKGVFYNEWHRTGSRAFILDTLNKPSLYDDILDPAPLRRRVMDHLDGRVDDQGLIHSLISLVLWREQLGS